MEKFSIIRRRRVQSFILLFLFIIAPAYTIAQQQTAVLSGRLTDMESARGADSIMVIAQKDDAEHRTMSDANGRFVFRALPMGVYKVTIASILYKTPRKTVHLLRDQQIDLAVEKVHLTLKEVFITATEAKSMTSTSIIDRTAMQHLQPSSFADLLELLPGGRASDPNLTSMNRIALREADQIQEGRKYDISSLGTAFFIDGAPINTTANLQDASSFYDMDPNKLRNSTSKGVDMRSISTDQIEKVEVVRGIPSVEYGDLTSGLIRIERKKGATPLSARMKTDGFSKLFSLGKGFNVPSQNMTLNVDLGYLDSKDEPSDNFENYKRINASVRMEKRWAGNYRRTSWNAALDYGTTIDNQRTDPDNGYAPIDKFKSTFNSYGLTTGIRNQLLGNKSLVKSWEVSGKVSYQRDRLASTKWIQARTATVLFNSMTAGEHDVAYLTPSYISDLTVDGQPLNAFLKGMAQLGFKTNAIRHQVKLGFETNFSKNFGKGQVYDINYPTKLVMSARPRAFDSIPGMLNQAFFAEDMLSVNFGRHQFTTALGLRGMSLLRMDKKYAIANKIYLDPRINVRWALPGVATGKQTLFVTLGAGYGLHTKMPTLDHLYPTWQYRDIVQLNFYHNNPAFRKVNAMTYILNRTNYDLRAAVNRKLELNADFTLNGNRLSLTYFHEKLTSGFRDESRVQVLQYKQYDNSSVDADNMTAPPATGDFAYVNARRFFGHTIVTNGSTLIKEGVEFQFQSRRLNSINTRFTVNGAWFNTTYVNTFPFYDLVSDVSTGGSNAYQYAGLYNDTDGYLRKKFNTNLTIDTYLPNLGMIVSSSIQNIWFTWRQDTWKSGTPVQYIDIEGNAHPYTEESKTHPDLQWLNQHFSATAFMPRTIPVDLQVNFKATKEFRKKVAISMFVNRLFTYTPDYYFNNVKIRRAGFISPYFGMELNLNL
ncbi:TonB-dependent receptor [Chitinophaga lutea]|uniref:TonB-dependent receptor n=1 Tax=Chitinophaga lutea TaxID=2488634 RepID=UPI00131512F4|nr:TonB-dependent receptor [Chitinophaga lutea]